jgi:hypothetical protein
MLIWIGKAVSVTFLSVLLLSSTFGGCGGTGGGGFTPAPTATISASPTTIVSGSSATLTGSCTNATSATASASPADSNWSGTVAMSGSAKVSPTATTKYTLTCNGNGVSASADATVTVTAPVPVSVTISPKTASAYTNGTQQFSATVSGSSNTAVTWSVNNVTGGNATIGTVNSSGLYTAPATVPNPATVTVTATSVADTKQFDSAAISIVAATAPTVALSCPDASVPFGGNQACTITTTGDPVPTLKSSVTGTGSGSISGNTFAYTLLNPTSAPASFLDTLTVTATNIAGSATATATVNLVPSIISATVRNSADPSMVFMPTDSMSFTVDLVGTGFFPGVTLVMTDICTAMPGLPPDSSHVSISYACGNSQYSPRPFHITFGEPNPGGGNSNTANLVFAGNLNLLAIAQTNGVDTEAYFLDQQVVGTAWKFKIDLTNGAATPDGSFVVGRPAYEIAVDNNGTGYIICSRSAVGPFDVYAPDGTPVPILNSNFQAGLSVSAGGGYMFGSQPAAGQVVTAQLGQDPTLTPLTIGNEPWETAGPFTLNNQRAGLVFNAGDEVLSAVPIPIPATSPAPLWTVTIGGFTPLNQLTVPPDGGWPLAVSQTMAKAAILSRHDGKVAVIDFGTKAQSTGTVTGHLLRMAADNVNKRFIITQPKTDTETSTFTAVDGAGNTTALTTTAPFYCTGFGVSSDGKWIYCGVPSKSGAPQFTLVANQ